MQHLRIILFIAVMAVVGYASYWKYSNTRPPLAKTTGENLPSQGQLVDLAKDSLRSHVQSSNKKLFLVNLWATWCGPCKVEFPALMEIGKKFPQLDLILVSLDGEEERSAAQEFLKSHGVSFKSYFKGEQEMALIGAQIPPWNGAIPASFLVNSDLTILEAWIGETTKLEFEAKIEPHLTPN